VNRFILNMAYLGIPGFVQVKIENGDINAISLIEQRTGRKKSVPVNNEKSFRAVLPAGEYLIEYGEFSKKLNIVSGGNYNIELDPLNNVELSVNIKDRNIGDKIIQIEAEAEGRGIHDLNIRVFNGTVSEPSKSVDLGEGMKSTVNWDVHIKESDSPWVCVIIPDGDLTWKKELTGTFEED